MALRFVKAIFILMFAFGPVALFAFGLGPQPFGGKILLAPDPEAVCPAGKPGSPFRVVPTSLTAPQLVMVGDYNPISLGFVLGTNEWILGMYWPTPEPECSTAAYRTQFHGTSKLITDPI